MRSEKIIVVAHKYNDILYSVDTEEFKNSHFKQLLIFKLPQFKQDDFPFLDKFDKVFIFEYDKENIRKNIIRFLFYVIKNRKELASNIAFFSNPNLLYNKIFAKLTNLKTSILVEDGLLNYVEIKNHISWSKKLFQKLLNINDSLLLSKTEKTYLSMPEKATLFGGNRVKLILSRTIDKGLTEILELLKGKKVFIGQNLYPKFCSADVYYSLVRKVMLEYSIDYYVPHAYEEYNNQLNEFNIYTVRKYTFEYFAQFIPFHIYSFASSLLMSSKIVNNNIESNLIRIKYCDSFYTNELLEICDHIYYLD